MVWYTFGPFSAYDPTEDGAAKGATFTVYDIDDTTNSTPLVAQNLGGLVITVTSDSDGVVIPFRVEDHPAVKIVSGSYSIPAYSVKDMRDVTLAASASAAASATSAAAAVSETNALRKWIELGVTRRNHVTNPKPTSATGWRISASETQTFVADDGGLPCLEAIDPVGGGSLYADPSYNWAREDNTAAGLRNIPGLTDGKWIAFGADVKALDANTAAGVALVRISPYAGTTINGSTNYASGIRPLSTSAYTRVTFAARVTAIPDGGHIRTLLWPGGTATPAGGGFRHRRWVIAVADTEAEALALVQSYWDGDTASSDHRGHAWLGTPNASESELIDMTLLTEGYVRTVNGIGPDANGNVQVAGGTGGVSSHHALSGNAEGDDHPQYLNASRGDTRYFTQAQVSVAIAAAVQASSTEDRKRSNHSGTQAISTVLGLQDALDAAASGGGADVVRAMVVASGTEPRPAGAAIVIWRDARTDQSTPPVNMGANDMWVTGAGAVVVDTVAPTVPAGLTTSSVTTSSLTLTWTASTDNVGVTGYEVRRNGSISHGVATGTTRNITGLTQNTDYTFEVRARDAAGNWSGWSAAAPVTTLTSTDTTAPTPPTGLSYTATSGSLTVSWGAGSDNVGVTGYDVRIDGGAPTTVPASPREYTFPGLDANTSYTLEVRSRDAAGNPSTWASLTGTTLEASETFSVFGASAPPGTWVLGTDGTPNILFAKPFYKFDSAGANGLPTGRVIGARVWIPTGATPPGQVTFSVWAAGAAISATPVATKVVSMAGATAGSWFEGYFDAPFTMPADSSWFFVGVQFTGAGDAGKYVYAPNARVDGLAVSSTEANIAWSESYGTGTREAFRIGGGSVTQVDNLTSGYGIDIIVDEG